MALKVITPELRNALRFVPKLDIPEHLLAEAAKLNIKAIYSVKDFNVSEFNVFGIYVIELPNSKFIDIDVIPNNIDSIIRILS